MKHVAPKGAKKADTVSEARTQVKLPALNK